MAGYFSFDKMITPRFVKVFYFFGAIALTAAGLGLATWAGMGLQQTTLPKQTGVYYVALGAGAVIIGNVLWRVLCELWIVLFNIHTLLASAVVRMGGYRLENEAVIATPALQAKPDRIEKESPRESVSVAPPKKESYGVTRPASSVLGLT